MERTHEMKTMKLTGIRQMEMMEVPEPSIENETDVKIRMKKVGVCGSDIHYYVSGRIGDQVVRYPFAVGHEGAGSVVAVGRGVTKLKPGDLVAIDPAMPCFECDQCRAGRHHTCRKLKFLGCPGQAEGCLSEFIVMPETSCYATGQNLTADQAALSEPLSIGLYATRGAMPLWGTKTGILGAGPIGMSVMMAAILQRPERIYMTDKIDERLNLVKRAGADWTGNPDNIDVVSEISRFEPEGLDVVFECCGKQEALDQAFQLLKPGGKLMVVGIPDFDAWQMPVSLSRHKELCIQHVRRQVNCVRPSLDLLEESRINAGIMITHRFGFSDTSKAFDLVAGYQDGVMKAMIDF